MSNDSIEWRCFHCDEVLTDAEQAALHFGPSQQYDPVCQIRPEHLRELERELERYREEDTVLSRQILRMQADHHAALQREEEKGYARGIADAALSVHPPSQEQDDMEFAVEHALKIALICGENPTCLDADLVGCERPITNQADAYRCTDCEVPFHKECAKRHFTTDTPEHAAVLIEEQLRRNLERTEQLKRERSSHD